MKIDILTLFPNMFAGPFSESIIKRAIDRKKAKINIVNIRDFTKDKHKTVDDRPYGGGVGMVMKVDVLDRTLYSLKSKAKSQNSKVILLTPQGKTFNQKTAQRLSKLNHLILICGHYEGFDERIRKLVDEEISIGDYVLTGGEIPAMVLIDSIVRLIPGVLKKEEAVVIESFSKMDGKAVLEFPQYTRPDEYKGMKVPKILLSGNHKKIQEWRKKEAIKRTKKRRHDL